MFMENEKRCFNCKFFATKDGGYSNYTVTETICHCLQNLNPAFPMEESYSWTYEGSETKDHEIVKVAETCESFKTGDQIKLDVEGDYTIEDWKEDEELYEAAKNYQEW
jgi:hypothetical protein